MKIQRQHFSALVVICLTFMTILNGCSVTSRAASLGNENVRNAGVNSSILHTFDETKNWVDPNASPYSSGLTSVKTPKVPSAFEQSLRPENGVASLYVSRENGLVGHSDTLKRDWTQEIHFTESSFKINGQSYSAPAEYRKQTLLLLPIDKGIVWAPVESQIPDMRHLQQALQGTTDIFYTPYLAQGGSLTNGAQLIGQLPHQWLGLDGPVIASAWTGWLPKDKVAMANVKTETAYHLEYTKNNQEKPVGPVQGNVPGWPTLYLRNLNQSSYYSKPQYAAYVQSLTRTYGGFILEINFVDATQSGRNAGMSTATYYWSEQSQKWTPLAQNYAVQTLAGWTDIGSKGVYWVQPCGVDNGSESALDVSEMYFDPSGGLRLIQRITI